MAGLTNNGVKVSIPDSLVPSGYTKPSVTEFADQEYTNIITQQFTVAKVDVDEAAAATTMAALVAALIVLIDAQITADFHIDTLDVTLWCDWTALATNFNTDEVLYTTGAINYLCTVTIYIKTA